MNKWCHQCLMDLTWGKKLHFNQMHFLKQSVTECGRKKQDFASLQPHWSDVNQVSFAIQYRYIHALIMLADTASNGNSADRLLVGTITWGRQSQINTLCTTLSQYHMHLFAWHRTKTMSNNMQHIYYKSLPTAMTLSSIGLHTEVDKQHIGTF